MLEDQTIDAPPASVAAKRTNAAPRERASASTVIKRLGTRGPRGGRTVADSRSMTALLPIMGVVSVAFLVIGLALPVLPLHVHQDLGLSTFVVGLVTGSQFAASLISRVWSGRYADSRGAKRAVVVGLLTAVMGGLLYLLSLRFVGAAMAIRHNPARRPGVARRSGELGYYGSCELGAWACRSREHRTRHCLGWHGDVRLSRVRGAGRHHALRARRLHRRRRRDDVGSAARRASGCPAIARFRRSAGRGPGS